jgi:hypothetical protein
MHDDLSMYSALVALLNVKRDELGYATEHQFHIVYTSLNPRQAVRDAKAFADGRIREFPDEFKAVGCIKVSDYCPQMIMSDGLYKNPACGSFFEWKCDYPGTFEDWANRESIRSAT